jgi:hypothetical protein
MKKGIGLLVAVLAQLYGMACPACEAQQPKVLRGITHGAGPSGKWDYFIVYVAVVIVLVTLFYSVKWLIRPGEKIGTSYQTTDIKS